METIKRPSKGGAYHVRIKGPRGIMLAVVSRLRGIPEGHRLDLRGKEDADGCLMRAIVRTRSEADALVDGVGGFPGVTASVRPAWGPHKIMRWSNR